MKITVDKEVLEQALGVLENLSGSPEDPNNGWRGAGGTEELFACEYCGRKHLDCTKIEHKPFCPVPKAYPSITAIREVLAQPKYRRGDRLICLETEEFCVIHISGTSHQFIKFPDQYVGQYTNEQVSELFALLPKEIEHPAQPEHPAMQGEPVAIEAAREYLRKPAQQQEPVARVINKSIVWRPRDIAGLPTGSPLYTSPPASKPRVGLTDEEIESAMPGGIYDCLADPWDCNVGDGDYMRSIKKDVLRVARSAIAAYEEKNGITGEKA